MSKMVLLGAGASVEAGVPDAYRMTTEIVNGFNNLDRQYNRLQEIINFVVGGLLFKAGGTNRDPFKGINVEDLFNAVMLLSERMTLEVSPFVNSWHPLVDAYDREQPFDDWQIRDAFEGIFEQISRNIQRAADGYSVDSIRWDSFNKKFAKAVKSIEREPGNGKVFRQTAEIMTTLLAKYVWIDDPDKVSYLQPLANSRWNGDRLVIATLNYDNTIELAANVNGVCCNTGIEVWSKKGQFDFEDKGLHLIKLHGSIDWSKKYIEYAKDRPMPHIVISKIDSLQTYLRGFNYGFEDIKPAVIFGQRNKLTTEGPFLELLRAFQLELSRSEHLVVIGYSFRDSHINTYLSNWLNESVENRVSIVDPFFNSSSESYMGYLGRLTRGDKAQVRIIRQKTSESIPELVESKE